MSKELTLPLPLPNPDEWLSTCGTQEALGISSATLWRWVKEGRLTKYTPRGLGANPMFWAPEVDLLKLALSISRKRATS